jgi:type IV pilus assembly protein PilP
MKKILSLLSISLLTACSNSSYQDLDTWMNERMKIEKGRIEPLPKAKTFIPIPFVARTDPFQERVPVIVNLEKNKFAPDLNRRKEPLESYPLGSLVMVGLLIRDNDRYAMIKVPEGTINYVKVGNYMGANYGLITKIEDEKILIEERVKNSADEWDTRETVVNLTESQK